MNEEIKMMNELVDETIKHSLRMMERENDPDTTASGIKFVSDLTTLTAAAESINEPNTKKFLITLTSVFASSNLLAVVLAKRILDNSTRVLIETTHKVINLGIGNPEECDGDCDKCKSDKENLAKTECIGKA